VFIAISPSSQSSNDKLCTFIEGKMAENTAVKCSLSNVRMSHTATQSTNDTKKKAFSVSEAALSAPHTEKDGVDRNSSGAHIEIFHVES